MASVRSSVGRKNTHAMVSIVPKCLALAVFALMLGSQVVSYGGPGTVLGSMFPSSAFGGSKMASSHASSLTQQNAAQTAGTPISPGTVKYTNTWNNTLALSCSMPRSISQPLLTTQNNWSASIQIPSQTFMFGKSDSNIQQNYTVYSNGTISVKDNSGNHFGFGLAGVQAVNGNLSTTFLSNSTYAILNYIVTNAGVVVSNVSIVFAERYQFCKPSGLEITIAGSENWGTANSGMISFAFSTNPTSVLNDTAWFDNSPTNNNSSTNPISLGFDWNNSASLNPVYSNVTNALSYIVGLNFTIDPTVIGTSTTSFATSNDYGDHVCQANGLYWFFYGNAANTPVYRTSTNGSSWSATKNVTTQIKTNFQGPFSMYCSGTSVYYEGSTNSNTQSKFWWGDGTMQSNGTVTWTYQNSVTTTNSAVKDGSISVDSSGNVWVSEFESNPSGEIQVYKSTNLATNTWSSKLNVTTGLLGITYATQIVGLTSGKMALLYGGASSGHAINITEWSGTAWSTTVTTGRSNLWMGYSSAVALGTTVDLATANRTDAIFYSFTYGASSWSSSTVVGEGSNVSLSTDGNSLLVLSYMNSTTIQYVASSNAGGSWGVPVTVSTTQSSAQFLSASFSIQSNEFLMGWTAGASSPYNVEFMAEPAIVPTAASNPLPWSQPGVAPYESYFTQLAESVSPGNGLVGVIQTDLSLPGRHGLNLQISRVYSTPYAFLSTSATPFNYDNYTMSNVGLGWSFDWPWLGQYYLHLTNGMVFAYNWTGNVFINHKTTNFALYANTNGTYTLYDASGTTYKFNSQKQLTLITDDTGNNTILFAYSTHGISNITDDAGRVVTFNYNIHGEVSSVSNGGRTWNYVYSINGRLNNVTDPLGHLTQYHYWAGGSTNNSWLLQNIIYPSGGKTGYVYGHANVGIDVVTYYATQQNEYTTTSLSSLTNSTSLSYHIINGLIQWVNTTTATGSGAEQNNLNFSFTGSSKEALGIKNASSQVMVNTQSSYDTLFRQNQSETLSPPSSVLSTASVKYDNWGNVVYIKDLLGHETWLSYSNTNTSNSFPGSSGFTNSFYSSTINLNIHDLLVGQADYQNGSGSAKQEVYYEYNSAGELIQSKVLHNVNSSNTWLLTSYTYDKYGNRLTTKDPLNRTTYYQYSSAYKSAFMTQSSILVGSQNITTSYGYNFTLGSLSSQKNPNGENTSYTHDNDGRQTATIYPLVGGVAATQVISYYDSSNYYVLTDPNGNNVTFHYDGLGRSNQTTYYNGSRIFTTENYSYSWLTQPISITTSSGVTKDSYDSLARLYNATNPDNTKEITSFNISHSNYTTTDQNGHPTEYIDNLANSLIAVRQYYNSTNYYQTNYTYDLSGNLLTIKDPNGGVTKYKYDDLNRFTSITFPDGKSQNYTYDNVGNVISFESPNGTTIKYNYDALNRLVNITYPGSSSVTLSYDKDGNRLSMSYTPVQTLDRYDARDRLTNETTVYNNTAYQLLYSYDKDSNVISMTYPDNSSVSFSFDFLNRITKVGNYANLTYTLSSQLNSTSLASGVMTAYGYNSMDRITNILSKKGSSTLLGLNYTYDSVGNVKSINSENYSYNWLNELTSAVGPWGTINYTYDGLGNILSVKQGGTTTNYAYGSYNRLSSAGAVNFTYDSNGNTVKEVNGSSTFNYAYDDENRLTSVTKNGTTIQNNIYSGDGTRVVQSVGSSKIVYVYQGANAIFEKNLTSGQVTDFYYGDGLQLAEKVASASFYYLTDELSSTRVVVNSTGSTVYSSNYKPFGSPYSPSGLNALTYIGQIFDTSTGLYYFNSRFYNDGIQRFTTEDDLISIAVGGPGLNRYAYVQNNPETLTDPSGHLGGVPPHPSKGNTQSPGLTSFINAFNSLAKQVTSSIGRFLKWAANVYFVNPVNLANFVLTIVTLINVICGVPVFQLTANEVTTLVAVSSAGKVAVSIISSVASHNWVNFLTSMGNYAWNALVTMVYTFGLSWYQAMLLGVAGITSVIGIVGWDAAKLVAALAITGVSLASMLYSMATQYSQYKGP
jgi:RHS repeat-associated protein